MGKRKTGEHHKSYWYDSERDLYIVSLPSRKNPITVPGEIWKVIREAYSNWDGAPASINALARKLGLARRTITELLRVMETTHDSAPWSDEEMSDTGEDALTEDLLRRKEEKVLIDAERKEYNRIKKDAEAYRRLDLAARRLALRFEDVGPKYKVAKQRLPSALHKYAVVLSPTDFHWGKYGPGDTYNRKIARKRLMQTTKELLTRVTRRGRPEVIYLALGGDGLHIDNAQKTTTAGTPQDCDGAPEELAWTWVQLCRDYVDLVRQYGEVKLFVIPGNHDRFTSVLLRAAMAGWFSQAKDVEVVEALENRQYVTYGNSLLTLMHGDIGKVKDWPAIIADEQAAAWGKSKWRFIFTGHYHTERELPTLGGVTVYRMPSLANNDAWHKRKGYSDTRKSLIAYIVHKEKGVVATEIEPV